MTVEMEANGDSRSTYERDLSLVGSLDSSYFCPASAALVGPVQNIFFPRRTLFVSLHLSPSPGNLDRQSCSVAFLLICVSGKKSQFVCKKINFKLSERQHIERHGTAVGPRTA
jgi:hypothetical protein